MGIIAHTFCFRATTAEYPTTSHGRGNGYEAHDGNNAAKEVTTLGIWTQKRNRKGMDMRPISDKSRDETICSTLTMVRHWEGKKEDSKQ